MIEFTALDAILVRLAIGLFVSAAIGILAHRRGSLTRSGVVGAMITGTLIFGFGGFVAGLLLIAFFMSSSLLSHFKSRDIRKQRAAEIFDKGGQRDLGQALANGGAATIFAVLSGSAMVLFNYEAELVLFVAMMGALATVNADTWATELGILSKSSPRLITTLKQVEPGTSGGISRAGLFAAFGGATFISLMYFYLLVAVSLLALIIVADESTAMRTIELAPGIRFYGNSSPIFIASVILGGVAGSLFDSFLGATVQAMYYREARHKETEKKFERDGTPNKPIRGWRWLNNDWVNFISSVFGAGTAALIAMVLT